jgi:hypothetical protein
MANIHIINSSEHQFTAAFHVAIPATNNAAGTPWRTVAMHVTSGSSVLPTGTGANATGTISSTELAQIQSGAIVEVVRTLQFVGLPSLADLDSFYTQVSNEYLTSMSVLYDYHGLTR